MNYENLLQVENFPFFFGNFSTVNGPHKKLMVNIQNVFILQIKTWRRSAPLEIQITVVTAKRAQ